MNKTFTYQAGFNLLSSSYLSVNLFCKQRFSPGVPKQLLCWHHPQTQRGTEFCLPYPPARNGSKKKSGNCWITHPNRETVLPVPLEGLYQHFYTYMRMHTGVIIQGAENILQLAEVLDYHVATVLQYKGYSVALRGLNRPQSYTHLLSAPLPYLEFWTKAEPPTFFLKSVLLLTSFDVCISKPIYTSFFHSISKDFLHIWYSEMKVFTGRPT